ncbi:MAG: alpha/beta fold hydrolase [Candidatus Moranbacteria bacterium]|nr:alpha/beta fold hydrolase [Candidatus Moranbacteria bacterium]
MTIILGCSQNPAGNGKNQFGEEKDRQISLQSQIGAQKQENLHPETQGILKNQKKPQEQKPHPMEIEALRQREYRAGDLTIKETLKDGSNYHRYVAYYFSQGLKIYGLLTIPKTPMPKNGYPAVIFVHGYIPPKNYSTINSYPTYQDTLAKAGFATFKPDLRGHGNSQGEAKSAHYSEKYLIDTLYAIEYLKNHSKVNPEKIVYWGHSNGGEIGLRVAVISQDIKAYSFWAGVVGSYEDMLETYNKKIHFLNLKERDNPLVNKYGLPSQNPDFWNGIDPYTYLTDIKAPIQIHHAGADKSVPIELSISLKNELEKINKEVEYFKYQGDDHNISKNSTQAFQRTIEFYRKYLNISVSSKQKS